MIHEFKYQWNSSVSLLTSIYGSLLRWFGDYLNDRNQKAVLHGESSQSKYTVLAYRKDQIPVLLLILINNIIEDITSSIQLFAGDTSIYIVVV